MALPRGLKKSTLPISVHAISVLDPVEFCPHFQFRPRCFLFLGIQLKLSFPVLSPEMASHHQIVRILQQKFQKLLVSRFALPLRKTPSNVWHLIAFSRLLGRLLLNWLLHALPEERTGGGLGKLLLIGQSAGKSELRVRALSGRRLSEDGRQLLAGFVLWVGVGEAEVEVGVAELVEAFVLGCRLLALSLTLQFLVLHQYNYNSRKSIIARLWGKFCFLRVYTNCVGQDSQVAVAPK